MRRVAVEWELSWMKNKKWYIVVKYWIDENDCHFWINHWTVLTRDKDYNKIKGETHVEEIDPKGDWRNFLKNRFKVETKDGQYKLTGNLEQCLDFIEKINDMECWEDWEWSNGKYGNIEIEEDKG